MPFNTSTPRHCDTATLRHCDTLFKSLKGTGHSLILVDSDVQIDTALDARETENPETVCGLARESMDHDHERVEGDNAASTLQEEVDNEILEGLPGEEVGAG